MTKLDAQAALIRRILDHASAVRESDQRFGQPYNPCMAELEAAVQRYIDAQVRALCHEQAGGAA